MCELRRKGAHTCSERAGETNALADEGGQKLALTDGRTSIIAENWIDRLTDELDRLTD